MMYDFNADDAFEIAEQMERNGGSFYRTAAKAMTDASSKALLEKLAAMEDDHEQTFARMRKQLKDREKASTVFDPQDESAQYLRALADTRVFFQKEVDTASLESILKEAIGAEKDSIVFYLGIRDSVPPDMGRDRLDEIIKEEMGHIRLLSKELMALKKSPGA